jgi:hypothetical protein
MSNRTLDRRYLGRVVRSSIPNDGYRFATVEAFVVSDEATGHWASEGGTAASSFPSHGCIHWHDADYGGLASKGRLVSFEVDPEVDRPDRSERYQLSNPDEAWEVIDLRRWQSDVDVQRALTNSAGALLRPEPLSMRALIWLPSGACAGPFRLKHGTTEGAYCVDAPAIGSDLTRVSSWQPDLGDVNAVFLDGYRRFFVGPFVRFSSNTRPQNWAPDEQVARRVLDLLRKMDPESIDRVNRAHKIEVTSKLFDAYLECVDFGRIGKLVPEVERARAERLRALQKAIADDEALLDDVLTNLQSIPSVQKAMADRADVMVQELAEARRAEQEPALREAEAEMERVREASAKCRGELAAIEAELAQKQSELDSAVAGYEEALGERLAALVTRPESAFAELSIVRALTQALDRGNALDAVRPTPAAARALDDNDIGALEEPTREFRPPIRCLDDAGQISVALVRAARAADASRQAMLAVHGALTAGLVPVVDGPRAYALLRAYGHVVAGGRVHWVPITPSTLEPADLLGRREAASGRILPAASGLLEAIANATDQDELHLVIFDGCNRAPADSYLLPILQSAEAQRSGDQTRAIPIASPAGLAEDDPYRRFARLQWPSNVLIACVPVDGSATLPLARSVWRHCAMVNAPSKRDIDEVENDEGGSTATPEASAPTEVPAPYWRQRVTGAPTIESEAREALLSRAREWRLTPQDLHDAEAVWLALRGCSNSSDLPLNISTVNVLAARAAAATPHASNAVRDAAGGANELREVVDAVERLCS